MIPARRGSRLSVSFALEKARIRLPACIKSGQRIHPVRSQQCFPDPAFSRVFFCLPVVRAIRYRIPEKRIAMTRQTGPATALNSAGRTRALLSVGAHAAAALVMLPIVMALLAAFFGSFETWLSLARTILPQATVTTILLALLVGAGTAVTGTVTAWLVTSCRFPGARIFEIALALPLAFPAYVLAYAYTVFLDYPGPVQTWLRSVMGWGAGDYWFPDIRSLGGAALVLTSVLYPYVYLMARAAFMRQSSAAFHSARTLGASPFRAFVTVSVPMARPAIAAGVALTMMETVADFGTVAQFGVQTYATTIYQAWFAMGDRPAAAQLSLCLLGVALVILALERWQRGEARRADVGRRNAIMARIPLSAPAAAAAMAACAVPVLIGCVGPALILGWMASGSEQSILSPRFLGYVWNSLKLAAIAAVFAVAAALVVGFARRFINARRIRNLHQIAGLGYAVPGSVIAVGLLVPFAAIDNGLDAFMRAEFGISTGLIFTGSVTLLIVAYVVRFLAPAQGAIDAGMETIRPSLDSAARTLGSTIPGVMGRIHLPILRTSVLTAFLIVFVDVMKELPATLIMRPFNYDTLAVHAYRLASDERLADAGAPALTIVAFGLVPVILLCRTLARRD
jgi:iron(III) transport system permease protein